MHSIFSIVCRLRSRIVALAEAGAIKRNDVRGVHSITISMEEAASIIVLYRILRVSFNAI